MTIGKQKSSDVMCGGLDVVQTYRTARSLMINELSNVNDLPLAKGCMFSDHLIFYWFC